MASNDLANASAVAMLAEGDLQQARRFWRETMGLQEILSSEDAGEVVFKAGDTVFAIYEHQGGSKADHTQLAFQVEDVAQAKRAIEAKGVRFEEYDLPNVKTVNGIADMGPDGQGAWFLDPGGNIIGIFTASSTIERTVGATGVMAGAGVS